MPVDVIHTQLKWMNEKDAEHIRITYAVGFSVEFLDVHVENLNGALNTSVYHKPAAEPYVLPYSSDHPRHVHVNIPYEALLRAARLCSHVDAFDRERLAIEMILLINGYSPRFIQRHFDRFFRLNQAVRVRTELDAEQYGKLHQKLLYLPTRRERNRDAKQVDKPWNKKILIVPHTFECGPLMNFKREFRQLWTKYYVYTGSVMKDVHLLLTSLSNPSLNDTLVHKKPSRSLLRRMDN
jgi:hypothetical protein